MFYQREWGWRCKTHHLYNENACFPEATAAILVEREQSVEDGTVGVGGVGATTAATNPRSPQEAPPPSAKAAFG